MKKDKIITDTVVGSIVEAVKLIPLVGPIIAIPTRSILSDFASRQLSKREEFRVGNTAFYCINKIKDKISSGEKLRDDDYFFANNENYRSSAEEIFEGVLIKCKNEHEEKKGKYIANIFVNTAFSNSFSLEEVNHLIKITDNLTYRQLCLLSLFEIHFNQILNIRFNHKDNFNPREISVLQEINELMQSGLLSELAFPQEEIPSITKELIMNASSEGNFSIVTAWYEIIPGRMVLTELGKNFYSILGLHEISDIEISELAILLKN